MPSPLMVPGGHGGPPLHANARRCHGHVEAGLRACPERKRHRTRVWATTIERTALAGCLPTMPLSHTTVPPMSFDPGKHHRRSIRLKGYDYSRPGAYFVTIVTQQRDCLFGVLLDGTLRSNDAGRMVERTWSEMRGRYPGVALDAFVAMPNHVHGIIVLTREPAPVGAGPRACPRGNAILHESRQSRGVAPAMSLPDVVHRFKSLTTACYRHGVAERAWTAFHARLWQRNYYDHIIRNDDDLRQARQYIADNPLRWSLDRESPGNR